MSPLLVTVLLSVHPIHPGLSDVHAEAVTPVMDRARAELDAVISKLKPHNVVTTAAYGSWFLPVVAVGGDLDFLGVVDLGVLPPEGVGEAAIQRIEALLLGLAQRPKGDPSMALLAVEGLDPQFKLVHRARAVELVERAAKGPSNVAYPLEGRQVPYSFPAGVVSLPLHPRAKYLSNAFNLDPREQANVREVSIQFFFTATAGGRKLLLQPLYGRAAAPIEMWRFVLEAAFQSPGDRASFAKVARPGFDDLARRAEYAAFMLMVADQEIEAGRAIKAVKRLAQTFLAVAPVVEVQARRRFQGEAASWLSGPAAVFDDLAAVAKIHAKAEKLGVEGAFRRSGDVARVVDGYLARLAKLEAGGLSATLMQVHTDGTAWARVAKAAKAKSVELAPKTEALREWSKTWHAMLAEASVRMVPVSGLQGEAVVIRAADLKGAPVPSWPLAPWRIEVRDLGAADPVRTIFSHEPRSAGWSRLRSALRSAPLQW